MANRANPNWERSNLDLLFLHTYRAQKHCIDINLSTAGEVIQTVGCHLLLVVKFHTKTDLFP